MELGDRKKRILRAIIKDYIETAEPVGSRTIAKKHMSDLSSATIRNEMADLEELGYLQQPHTSAGRVPSDMGYRLYVDSLMERYKLSMFEMTRVRETMESRLREADELLAEASLLLSKLTNYTALAMPPELKDGSLQSIQLVPVDARRLLIVLVTNEGIVRNRLLGVQEEVTADEAQRLSNILNGKLTGVTLEELNQAKLTEIRKEAGSIGFLLDPIVRFVSEVISDSDAGVHVDGMSNILSFPEYSSVDRARDILNFLDNKRQLHELITHLDAGKGNINIIIGSENPLLHDMRCSMVYYSCPVGSGQGRIGVIGPTRMDYARVVSTLEYLAEYFNRAVKRIFSNDDEGGAG